MNHMDAHAHSSQKADIQRRLIVSIILTALIFLLPYVGDFAHVPHLKILLALTQFILSSIVYFYGGMPFLKGMYSELQIKKPGMMTLVGIAITVAYIYSSAVLLLGLKGMLFYGELATLIVVMLFGHWIEMRAVQGAESAVESLVKLLPAVAYVVEGTKTHTIPIAQVKIGMKLLIHPGEKIPADGSVVEGESEVNEAALTGESIPVFKHKGDKVIAGSINGNGSLTITVTADQKNNYIAQVIRLVSEVMESKSQAQDMADKAAFILTIAALIIGVITFFGWLVFSHKLPVALEHMVTVMVTACPHALGLAIPLVVVAITTLAAQRGILIRNRKAFENAAHITGIAFDKTGTLTYGHFTITDVISTGTMSEHEIIALGASTEKFSKHAIATAMFAKARELKLPLLELEGKTIPGKGVEAYKDGKHYFIGNKAFMEQLQLGRENQESYKMALAKAEEFMKQGKTVSFVATSERIEAIIAASDVIRPESYEACSELKKKGYSIAMLTGDNELAANAVARALQIDDVRSQINPEEKALEIKRLQKQEKRIAMVGDGINDAPALAAADVGIAIGAGTDVAQASSDIILVRSDPRAVLEVIELSRTARHKIMQNILWATGYNVVALPLAAGLFSVFGIALSPSVGALLMALSTVIVALNSRFFRVK